ncbi:MAG: DUF4292 domain-containing protein [Bacteroidetes bacterium]|nr:MAG: DUF4292 domain-containing protein [Bacteroidota bacterium]
MKKNNLHILLIISALWLFSACKTTEKKTAKLLKVKSKEKLIENIRRSEAKPEWISIKSSVAFKTDKVSDSFKMYFRLRTDSALWISATYYAVEVARFLITPDTLKYMDRKNNKYFVGNIAYLENKFDLQFDFYMLQDILLGNIPDSLNPKDVNVDFRKKRYELYSFKKRWIKKSTDEKNSRLDGKLGGKVEKKQSKSIAVYAMLNNSDYRPETLKIIDLLSQKQLIINYTEYSETDSLLIPHKYKITIISDLNMEAEIEYLKTKINEPLKMSFTIPEKYEPME